MQRLHNYRMSNITQLIVLARQITDFFCVIALFVAFKVLTFLSFLFLLNLFMAALKEPVSIFLEKKNSRIQLYLIGSYLSYRIIDTIPGILK